MAGDIQTTSGSKFYISTAAAASGTDTLLEYEALTWTEVMEVEDLGNIGDVSTEVTGAAIGDSRIRKAKGARNAGTMNVICFDTVPLDDGQVAVIAAEASYDNYAFKIEFPPPATGTPEIWYFRGLVMSNELRLGTNDNIRRRAFNIGVNSAITIDPATTVLMAREGGGEGSTTATPQNKDKERAAATA
jgi:hypothetical protein